MPDSEVPEASMRFYTLYRIIQNKIFKGEAEIADVTNRDTNF